LSPIKEKGAVHHVRSNLTFTAKADCFNKQAEKIENNQNDETKDQNITSEKLREIRSQDSMYAKLQNE
jgi:hypothetical protein